MLNRLLPAAAVALLLSTTADAAYETPAGAAWLYDVTTDTVLFEKNAEQALPPASMSKLMTLNMLFEALRDGRVTLDTQFGVSDRAAAMKGSTMYLDQRDRPTVEDLIKGIIVQSGNDACVVVAEGLAGSEAAFARLMNERAPEIGLENSTFVNASGWPAPSHRMSPKDLGRLATRLITEFPEYYPYFAIEEWEFDGRSPANRFNRNPLLGLVDGADGLKTGHTEEAGYGLVGSAVQDDRRVVFVVAGLDSMAARSQESEQIANWAFRQFVSRDVAEAGDVMAVAPVWMGADTSVGLVAADDITLLVPAFSRDSYAARVEYDGPIAAGFEKGQHIADLVVTVADLPEKRIPLVSDRAVAEGGFVPRMRAAVTVLFRKALDQAFGDRGAPVEEPADEPTAGLSEPAPATEPVPTEG